MAATCEMVEVIGRQNLIRLQEALGPAHIYLPAEPVIGHPIANAIGKVAMAQLCREFGSCTIWIGCRYAHIKRNAEILQLRMIGVPSKNIAKSFGITARHVRQLTQGDITPVYGVRRRQLRAAQQGIRMERHERYRRKVGRNGTPNRQARRLAAES